MKRTHLLPLTAALAAALGAQAGDITGKVTLKGTPPPERELPLDPSCGKLWPTEKPKTRFYVVGADGGLGDTFVYLQPASLAGKTFPAPGQPGILDQKGCEYLPYILGLQVGQKLVVKNSDPLLHNVHATPTKNKGFNLAQMANGKDIERVFDKEEVFVRFKCDVHPWMFAYVGVLSHPFHAVTDKDGGFTIPGVPAGKYKLVAFHRKTHVTEEKALVQDIEVTDAGAKAAFTVELPAQ
jgi:hypothetical protein